MSIIVSDRGSLYKFITLPYTSQSLQDLQSIFCHKFSRILFRSNLCSALTPRKHTESFLTQAKFHSQISWQKFQFLLNECFNI